MIVFRYYYFLNHTVIFSSSKNILQKNNFVVPLILVPTRNYFYLYLEAVKIGYICKLIKIFERIIKNISRQLQNCEKTKIFNQFFVIF